MTGRVGISEGSPPSADAIQAFCRHLGELCDVLSAPYDAEALAAAARGQELQATNCNVLLHNALYQWLGERVELSLSDEDSPEEAARRARDSTLAKIQNEDMLSEFVHAVANTCANPEALVEVPKERGKQSLLFDLQGPIDLLGPDEVDTLLSELTTSDSPITALEALSSDVHLLEDICFGPTWPQLCDALGRLVCLPAAAAGGGGAAAAGGGAAAHYQGSPPAAARPQPPQPSDAAPRTQPQAPGQVPQHAQQPPPQQQRQYPQGEEGAVATPSLPRQQQLLLAVLQELVSSGAASSPPHAAELLDALAPYLTALVLRMALPAGDGRGGGGAAGSAQQGAAPGLMAAAAALDPFAVDIMRIAHQLLVSLAAEYHMLPPGCAALAARAVCDVVRAGVARGAPAPAAASGSSGRWLAGAEPGGVDGRPVFVDLSALDLLVLLDPELRWWQRLCAATHATQPVADAAAATQLAAALETALQAWAAAAAAAAAATSSGGGGGSSRGGLSSASGGRSSTHLVACTALLGGLVRANSLSLLACEAHDECCSGAGGGAAAPTGPSSRATEAAASNATAAGTQRRLRLQRMLGHLVSCFCVLSDKPWLFRPREGNGAAAPSARVSNGSSNGDGGGGGSVFLLLSADVLSSAAAQGTLSLLAPGGASSSGGGAGGSSGGAGSGGASLAPLLQAMLRAAATTASAALALGTSPGRAVLEAEAWLQAAARVLDAAAEHASLAVSAASAVAGCPKEPEGQPAAAEAMCGVLRHLAGRVRGCAAAAASAAPSWSLQVVRAAAPLAAVSPTVAAGLGDLYDTLHAVLSARVGREPEGSTSRTLSPTRSVAQRSGGGGSGGGGSGSGTLSAGPSLLDILDGGAPAGQNLLPSPRPAPQASPLEPDLDSLELLAGVAVMSYCRLECTTTPSTARGDVTSLPRAPPPAQTSSATAGTAVAAAAVSGQGGSPPRLVLLLPSALRRQLFLECAARLLCKEYDNAGDPAPGDGWCGRAHGGAARVGGRVSAAKRRVFCRAEAVARCCAVAERTLVAAGFARRVLNDVAAVLQSGEYELPYLEPLPYADPLAGRGALLAELLCWPGLLQLAGDEDSEDGDGRGVRGDGDVGSESLRRRHREEVLALLQELVTWLDARGAAEGLAPADAAVVSLRAFSALVAADPTAGAALERETNIRWYLQNLCGELPETEGPPQGPGGAANGATGAHTHHGEAHAAGRPPSPPHPQSDMLLDIARGVLRALRRPTAA